MRLMNHDTERKAKAAETPQAIHLAARFGNGTLRVQLPSGERVLIGEEGVVLLLTPSEVSYIQRMRTTNVLVSAAPEGAVPVDRGELSPARIAERKLEHRGARRAALLAILKAEGAAESEALAQFQRDPQSGEAFGHAAFPQTAGRPVDVERAARLAARWRGAGLDPAAPWATPAAWWAVGVTAELKRSDPVKARTVGLAHAMVCPQTLPGTETPCLYRATDAHDLVKHAEKHRTEYDAWARRVAKERGARRATEAEGSTVHEVQIGYDLTTRKPVALMPDTGGLGPV